ncbi:heme ABC transporter ATP-binding protein [Roseibium sp.]|uniref:heme ABC transporter ATP-binding protein n=1 Tax=Roseibium sp. TaxID=1936156 RepID=UPI003A975726
MTSPFTNQENLREAANRSHLSIEGVGIAYGKTLIVDGVKLSAEAGKVHTIIGPNGSGKSTLLKAISGELRYAGSITLAGHGIAESSTRTLANIRGVLPQHSALSFPLTVAEVVNLGILKHAGTLSQADRHQRILDALCLVDLKGFETRTYQTLSGGEQQRVQLARVLCQVWEPVAAHGTPRWLFLDEPVSSLDIKHQMQIMDVARGFARRGGGVLAIMHDLNLTGAYADTVTVLRRGKILAHGSVEDVYRDEILSAAYDYDIRVARIDGHDAPVVLAS